MKLDLPQIFVTRHQTNGTELYEEGDLAAGMRQKHLVKLDRGLQKILAKEKLITKVKNDRTRDDIMHSVSRQNGQSFHSQTLNDVSNILEDSPSVLYQLESRPSLSSFDGLTTTSLINSKESATVMRPDSMLNAASGSSTLPIPSNIDAHYGPSVLLTRPQKFPRNFSNIASPLSEISHPASSSYLYCDYPTSRSRLIYLSEFFRQPPIRMSCSSCDMTQPLDLNKPRCGPVTWRLLRMTNARLPLDYQVRNFSVSQPTLKRRCEE
ncbi:unnamed protein product [Protopolystoma xenopodis]|uniref:Uncharacterized protein n=1 Tax=Protopolystoma xenopodis TaxID=117903 RepID=A0A448WRQ5_9PLAT|nr:unnamed protein product [Protopolystoma xenopodis]